MTEDALDPRPAIAAACRTLAARGLVEGSAGNVSVRVGELVAITATGARFESLTADHVVLVDADGAVVDGDFAPTSELELHLAIHFGIHADTATGAVVHTHAPNCVALGLIADELPCIHYQLLQLGGAVPVAPYATFGTPELAASVRTALTGRSAALMANHGAVTHAADLRTAVEHTLLLEWACGIYLTAVAAGTPRGLDAAEQRAAVEAALGRGYGSIQRAKEEGSRHE